MKPGKIVDFIPGYSLVLFYRENDSPHPQVRLAFGF